MLFFTYRNVLCSDIFIKNSATSSEGRYIEMLDGLDMCERHKLLKWEFELDPDKWDSLDPSVRSVIVGGGWKSIKYFQDDGRTLSTSINELPDDSGGIYVFFVRPELIPDIHLYVMYIGRARRKNNTYSLQKRCRDYATDTRPKISTMRKYYGKFLYLAYLPLADDTLITKVEKELIRVVIPPCNADIYDYNVLPAVSAFGKETK